jgi:rhamnogalacturonyl hydrolase YesR
MDHLIVLRVFRRGWRNCLKLSETGTRRNLQIISHDKVFNRQVWSDSLYLSFFLVQEIPTVRICRRETHFPHSIKIKTVLFAPEIELDLIMK